MTNNSQYLNIVVSIRSKHFGPLNMIEMSGGRKSKEDRNYKTIVKFYFLKTIFKLYQIMLNFFCKFQVTYK